MFHLKYAPVASDDDDQDAEDQRHDHKDTYLISTITNGSV